jgi:hypothetical protein
MLRGERNAIFVCNSIWASTPPRTRCYLKPGRQVQGCQMFAGTIFYIFVLPNILFQFLTLCSTYLVSCPTNRARLTHDELCKTLVTLAQPGRFTRITGVCLRGGNCSRTCSETVCFIIYYFLELCG